MRTFPCSAGGIVVSRWNTRSRGSAYESRTDRVSSVEPLFDTSTSMSLLVCASALSIARRTSRGRLSVGIAIVSLTRFIETPLAAIGGRDHMVRCVPRSTARQEDAERDEPAEQRQEEVA